MSAAGNPENASYRRLAIFLMAIGALFALDSLLRLEFVYKLWPLVITVLGVGLVGIYAKQRESGAIYLAAGEYLVCFSGLAFYCNFSSWDKMARLWPLFIAFLGVVFVTLFLAHRKRRYLLLSGFIFLSLAALFFIVFSSASRYWWTIFILVGLSVLASERSQ